MDCRVTQRYVNARKSRPVLNSLNLFLLSDVIYKMRLRIKGIEFGLKTINRQSKKKNSDQCIGTRDKIQWIQATFWWVQIMLCLKSLTVWINLWLLQIRFGINFFHLKNTTQSHWVIIQGNYHIDGERVENWYFCKVATDVCTSCTRCKKRWVESGRYAPAIFPPFRFIVFACKGCS